MGSHHCVSPLVLCARMWFCVVLPLPGPQRPVTAPATLTAPAPLKPQRHRSHEPNPCEGLTHNPPWVLGERDPAPPKGPPPLPPAPMPSTHRRPRALDTARPWCPHSHGASRGWRGLGHRRAHGHPRGRPRRQCHCLSGQGDVREPHGPIFHGPPAEGERIVRVLAWLAEGWGLRATARVCAGAPQTVVPWLGAAAAPRRAFAASCLGALHREPWPLDALDAGRRARKAGASRDAAARQRLERSPYWGWTALAPTRQWRVAVEGASRPLALAPRVGQQGPQRLAPGGGLTVFDRWPPGRRHRPAAPCWSVEAPCTAPGQRAPAPAPLEATARGALRSGGPVVPAPTPRRRPAPRGLRSPAGHRPARSALRRDHPSRVGRAPPSRPPPAPGGQRTPGPDAGAGRHGRAGAAGPVAGLAQLRVASRQSAPAGAAPRSHQRVWRGAQVAAVHPGAGGRGDGARGGAPSRAPLPGAAVAASSSAGTRARGRGAGRGAASVCLQAGKAGCTRSCKPVSRLADRLMGTLQTAQEGAVSILRRAQGRDRPPQPQHPPACRSGGTTGHASGQRRGRLAAAAGVVSGL
jgi:hypothetical protein